MDAAMGEGLLQRGSSWLEFESRPCLLDDALENRDLFWDISADCAMNSRMYVFVEGVPVHSLGMFAWSILRLGHATEVIPVYPRQPASMLTYIRPNIGYSSVVLRKSRPQVTIAEGVSQD